MSTAMSTMQRPQWLSAHCIAAALLQRAQDIGDGHGKRRFVQIITICRRGVSPGCPPHVQLFASPPWFARRPWPNLPHRARQGPPPSRLPPLAPRLAASSPSTSNMQVPTCPPQLQSHLASPASPAQASLPSSDPPDPPGPHAIRSCFADFAAASDTQGSSLQWLQSLGRWRVSKSPAARGAGSDESEHWSCLVCVPTSAQVPER